MKDEARSRVQAWIVAMPRDGTTVAEPEPTVWGLSAGERLRRSLLGAGVSGIELVGPDDVPADARARSIVLRDDLFYDERVLAGLLSADDVVLVADVGAGADEAVAAACGAEALGEVLEAVRARRGAPLEGVPTAGILDLVPAYNPTLRKSDPPFVLSAGSGEAGLARIENRIFAASYKGITDLVTKWVFPLPARAAVRVLARRGVHPNSVTAVSYVLAAAVTWLFAEGWLLTGLVLGWAMTFLDTVDGKLARCTLTSSTFGNVFDHALDLVHPPIWWAAWAAALAGGLAGNELALWVVVGGYLVGRLLEGTFSLAFGFQLFVWRPFDGVFRAFIARRNPNLILLSLGLAVGSPVLGFQAVAVWTAVCIAIAGVRNVQAHVEARRGVEIRSWLEDAPPATS